MKKLLSLVLLSSLQLCIVSLYSVHSPNHINIKVASEFDSHIGKGKPALAYFNSLTCGPCKAFHPTFEQLALEHPDVLFIEVTSGVVQSIDQLFSKYSIRGFPTFVFFDSNGVKIDSFSGANGDTKIKIEKQLKLLKTGMAKPEVAPVIQSAPLMPEPAMKPAKAKKALMPGQTVQSACPEAVPLKPKTIRARKVKTSRVKSPQAMNIVR